MAEDGVGIADLFEKVGRDANDVVAGLEASFGLDKDRLARIGALILQWSAFDAALERAIWHLGLGTPKETDPQGFEQRIEMFERAKHMDGDPRWPILVDAICEVGRSVLGYRNTIAHGVPSDREVMARNYFPIDVKRKRSSESALIKPLVLNAAISALLQTLHILGDLLDQAGSQPGPSLLTRNEIILQHLPAIQETWIYIAAKNGWR